MSSQASPRPAAVPASSTYRSAVLFSDEARAKDTETLDEKQDGCMDDDESFEANQHAAADKDCEKPEPPVPIQRPARPRLDERATTMQASRRTLPQLKRKETRMMQKQSHPWEHLGITLGGPAILLFDLVIPCIIYYTWYNGQKHDWDRSCQAYTDAGQRCPIPYPEYDKDILGYAIICFGFGELWILVARVWRLWFRHDECAPLLSRAKWELDATSWVYGVAMILALIPFVIGSSLELPHLYLYSPSFIMGFLGILMAITTCLPFKIPVGINSHARGSGLRPFIYYAAEDFIAVDGLQDREFRVRYNDRYNNNASFRKMFRDLTLWWMLGVCIYIGSVSAVIWTVPFHIAFGLSFGVLFSYIAVFAGTTFLYVKYEIARQHRCLRMNKISSMLRCDISYQTN